MAGFGSTRCPGLLTLLAALLCLVGTSIRLVVRRPWRWPGVGRALDSGSIQAWQVDALKIAGLEPQLDRLIGRFHSSVALGLAIGAIVGGYLPQWLGAPLPNGNPTHWNLLLQAGLTGLHLVLLGWLFREGEHRGDPTTTPLLHLLRQALQAAFRLPTLRLGDAGHLGGRPVAVRSGNLLAAAFADPDTRRRLRALRLAGERVLCCRRTRTLGAQPVVATHRWRQRGAGWVACCAWSPAY